MKNKAIIIKWFENHIAELQRQLYQDCEGDFERSEKQADIDEAYRMLEILKSL